MPTRNDRDVIQRTIGTLLVLLGVLIPLFFLASGWDPFRFPKVLLLRCFAVLIATTVLLGLIWREMSLDPRTWGRPEKELLTTAGLLLLWTTLSAVVNERSWFGPLDLLAAFVVFFSSMWYGRRRGDLRFLRWMCLPGLVTVAVLLMQVTETWNPVVDLSDLSRLPAGERILLRRAALLGNRDDVGIYLLVPFALTLYFALKWRGRDRIVASVAAVILLGGVILSTTATGIAIAVALLISLTVRPKVKRLARFGLPLVILGLVGALLVGRDLMGSLSKGTLEAASGHRLGAFATATTMILERPVLGVGPTGFPIEYVEYASRLKIEHRDWLPRTSEIYFDMVHNDYLEVGAETGLPGLALALAFAALLIRRAWRSLRRDETSSEAWLALSIVGVVLLSAFVQFPLQIAGVYGTIAIVGGSSFGVLESDDGG